jgi:hypothetical protein
MLKKVVLVWIKVYRKTPHTDDAGRDEAETSPDGLTESKGCQRVEHPRKWVFQNVQNYLSSLRALRAIG